MPYTSEILKVDFRAKTALIAIYDDKGKEIRRDHVSDDRLSVPAPWAAVAAQRLQDGIKEERDKAESRRQKESERVAKLEAAKDESDSVIIQSVSLR